MGTSAAGYWSKRYREHSTPWDIGLISTPLKTYINSLTDKDLHILVPGAGNGYEAIYLFENGFRNTQVVDIASEPLENLSRNCPGFPREQLIHGDFFGIEGTFDLILEQTFFCALPPERRTEYVRKVHGLLELDMGKAFTSAGSAPRAKAKKATLAGLFFDFALTSDGPPFGGSQKEYSKLFSPYFHIKTLERCRNSIPDRQGKELFFIFEKKPA